MIAADSAWSLLAQLHCKGDLNGSSALSTSELRKLVMDYVWQRMRRNGEVSPPFLRDPIKSEFVKSQKIKLIRESDSTNVHGMLVAETGGFVLLVKSGLEEHRRRSVVAHEIGHTFFYDIDVDPPVPYMDQKFSWELVEGPAYEIGRQILLPEKWLLQQHREPCIETFLELQKTFNVSQQLLARRLIHDLKLWDVLILLSPETTLQPTSISPVTTTFKGPAFANFKVKKHSNELYRVFSTSKLGIVAKARTEFGRGKFIVESLKSQYPQLSVCFIKKAE
jgi:hypothetical protein